jgi:hypothetical protein
LKKLLIVLFLNNSIFFSSLQAQDKNVSLLLLDKSSSTKYQINFSNSYFFRDLAFELVSCNFLEFDKYIDIIALIKIKNKDENFIGWFFKYTDELNLYSNKIYEISLLSCIN